MFQYECEEFSMKKALWHQWFSDERTISDEWLASERKAQDDDESRDDEWLECHQKSIDSKDFLTVLEFLKRRSMSSYCINFDSSFCNLVYNIIIISFTIWILLLILLLMLQSILQLISQLVFQYFVKIMFKSFNQRDSKLICMYCSLEITITRH